MSKKNRGNFKRLLGNFDSSLSVGKRFVFFQSLGETASKEGSALFGNIYKQVYSLGLNYVNQAMAKLTGTRSGQIDYRNSIINYIQEIGKAANNELAVQTNFVEQIYKKMDNNNPLKAIIAEHSYLLNPKSGQFDYTQFIYILNKSALQYLEAQEKRTETILHNSKLMRDNLLKQTQEIQNEIHETFLNKDYRQYEKKLRQYDILKAIDENNSFQKSYVDVITRRANEMIQYYMHHLDNKALTLILINSMNDNLEIDEQQMGTRIMAYIIEYLTTANYEEEIINNTAPKIREGFEQFLQNAQAISKQKYEDLKKSITGTTVKSIEETSIIFGEGVAQIFISLEKDARTDIIERYKIADDLKKILGKTEELSKISAAQKGKITKLLNQVIAKEYNLEKEKLRKLDTSGRRDIVKSIKELQKSGKAKAFSSTKLQKSLKNSFKVKLSTGNFAEFITKIAVEKVLSKLGTSKVGLYGNALKVKADVGFSISFSGLKSLNSISEDALQIKEELKDKILNLQEDFLNNYKQGIEKENNATNVEKAVIAHLQTYDNLITRIEQLAKQGIIKNKQQILNEIQDSIQSQISIKQYAKSGPFGFEGGSLGAGDRAGPVLQNIGKMYETGGISPIDYETLYFAAINCGGDALGSELKQPLQQYLLGGAALMMFDDGFTATEKYLKTMQENLGFSKGTLHLYSVQGRLVPASFILSSIYQNLLSAYQNIISQSDTLPEVIAATSGNAVTITNSITEGNIPDWHKMPAPQDRWNKVAGDASAGINIKFTFLGGMLDMFEAIANAFNI